MFDSENVKIPVYQEELDLLCNDSVRNLITCGFKVEIGEESGYLNIGLPTIK